ncbi:MAG TPA: tetratricopeptide repeat protein, partial [Nitrospiria bacterium]|nr:tetratricopeptide repeat protein [Nitrospiria bacterium]
MGEKQEIPKEPVQGGPENKGENKPGEKPGDKPGDKPAEKVKVVSPEVLDLAEKVAGDPKSRLFVKLAEEYLKSEMVDEAIAALNDGLKNHPSFFAAKVMLGRALLEKGDIAEAKATFEGVVSVNPDNLLAQRKLAGIYKDEGNIGAGRSAAQAVLALNPKDEEMLEVVKALEELEEASGHGGLVDIASGAADSDFVMPLEQTS